jgi:hypothetical protein
MVALSETFMSSSGDESRLHILNVYSDLDFADDIAVLERHGRACRNSLAKWKWKQEQLDYA